MPRVSRLRIVNFKFDDNRKQIADELLEMQGCNTLMNLENGGGKSAMLQLALQVMLPNSPLGSRRMVDYFNLNSGTVHILLEWLLDSTGAGQQYLLTGFCCRKGQEGLDYFMYVRPHTGSDEYDIENIPVVSGRREVAGYHEYYRYVQSLSKEPGTRMNLFRQNEQKKYRVQLEAYNLFEEEFRAIRTINQSEGGIEKFFEKARTSRQVIERLIIPSIPSGEENSNVLVDSLKKHMENLRTIPELQSRIKTYDSFCSKAKVFLTHIRDYAKVCADHSSIAANILALENLLEIAKKMSEKEYEEYSVKKDAAGEKQHELYYMRDSLSYSKSHHEAEALTEKADGIKGDMEGLEKELNEFKLEYNNSLSVNDWLEMMKEKEKLREKNAQLVEKQQEKQEWNERYQKVLAALKYLYEDELKSSGRRIGKLVDSKENLDKEAAGLRKIRSGVSARMKDADNRIYHVEMDVKRLDGETKKVISRTDGTHSLFLDPEKSRKEMDTEIEGLENKIKSLLDEMERLKVKTGSVEDDIGRTGIRIAERRKDTELLEKELESIKEAREALESRLKNYEIPQPVYKDSVLSRLQALIENERSEYNRVLGSRLSLENKKLIFEHSGGYVPDYAIKKLVDLFTENDINAIPGSIWIAGQPEDIRRSLVELNPYLPYSVIIEEKSIDAIGFLTNKIRECVEGYPVWIVTAGGEAVAYPGGDRKKEKKRHAFRLLGSNIYIIDSEAFDFSVDRGKFEEYVEKLGAKIEDIENAAKTRQEGLSALEMLDRDVKRYTGEYPEELVQAKQTELDEMKAELERDGQLQERLKSQLEGLKADLEKNGEMLEEGRKQLEHIRNQRELMKKYIELTDEIRSREKALGELRNEYKELRAEDERLEGELSEKEKKLVDVEKEIDSLESDMEDLREKTRDIGDGVEALHERPGATDSIEELEARKNALEKNLGDINMEHLQELIQKHQAKISECEKRIAERGTDRGWLEKAREGVSQSRLEGLRKRIEETEKRIYSDRVKINELEREISRIGGQMGKMKSDINERYGKEPHVFDSITGEQEIRLEKDIKAAERRLSSLNSKLTQIDERRKALSNCLERVSEFSEYSELRMHTDGEINDSFHSGGRVIDRWDISSVPDKDIAAMFNKARNEYRKSEEKLDKGRKTIDSEFGALSTDTELHGNQNIKGLMSRIGESEIYNFEAIECIFENVFNSIENLRKAAQAQLENLGRDRKEMILRCLRRARAVYDEVKSVDRFSRISIGDSKQRVIRIKTPPVYEEQAENLMGQYLDACMEELSAKRLESGFDPAKIDDEIRRKMKPSLLMDAIAPLASFRIDVCKPGHNLESSRYIEWEKVISWSGGEKLAGFFAMFIAIVSYLRYKKTHWYGSKKVIWIDNPFGQANAGYLLDYIFELAKTTNTQMICLTGLQETSIYEKFDVVYSLVHRMTGPNTSVISSRKVKADTGMESGMYKVGHTQMSLFEE